MRLIAKLSGRDRLDSSRPHCHLYQLVKGPASMCVCVTLAPEAWAPSPPVPHCPNAWLPWSPGQGWEERGRPEPAPEDRLRLVRAQGESRGEAALLRHT